ncbi:MULTISPECIES: CdaR family transcriptional regulator [Bifidobacterium]|uniref:CdaR family transcriptional regulator n=1 Tax=Bifidobacterium TaxID=1678 RepID=UPI0018DD13EA|nr:MULTISPECIES: sugar diacid recognition domain-containing protein [Bifidobacterium]MBI0048715.1 helix-turn-helix domain-containing protein [Bifidobacterium choladohabitans]MBI0149707.1 helix-turn-helix domain-containing protein [Bifidobacterium sp. M0353]
MTIDPATAQTIVDNLKDVIEYNINFFDTEGTMVASTDPSRIGSFHDAARQAAVDCRTVAVDRRHPYQGARDGVNVPVVLNDAVVAVIGITGPVNKVGALGGIIERMTELMLFANMEQIARFNRRIMTSNLVNLLTLEHKDDELMNALALALDLDLPGPRRALVGRAPGIRLERLNQDRLYERLCQTCLSFGVPLFAVSPRDFRIYAPQMEDAELDEFVTALRQALGRVVGSKVVLGAGMIQADPGQYWHSYRQACVAARWAGFTTDDQRYRYEQMGVGRLITSLPIEQCRAFVDQVFAGLESDRVDRFERVFSAYTRHNGSITHAAQELFIHKNTMQNRLDALARETGYNPRRLSDYPILATAFELRRYLAYRDIPDESAELGEHTGTADRPKVTNQAWPDSAS